MEDHLTLIPAPFDEYDNLERVADVAEADIIKFYTKAPHLSTLDFFQGSGASYSYVYLRGYKTDPDEIDEEMYPTLKKDIQRTIAAVIVWKIQQERRTVDVVSESDPQGKGYVLRADRLEPFPPNWDRWLREYDIRRVTWSL